MSRKLISIIIPCYNEEANILHMYKRVRKVFRTLTYRYEMIFVDNDSTDTSQIVLEKLAHKDKGVRVVFMSRNFGSPQPSFSAGLELCSGDAAILIHGDIQDPPELMPKFIKKWEQGFDVVYGIIIYRKGYGRIMNFFYKAFYSLIHKLAYFKVPHNASEFSLIDRKVVKELINIGEYDYYMRFLRAYVGYKQTGIEFVRDPRVRGSSTETIFSGVRWAISMIINFSFKPLEWVAKIALVVMLTALISLAVFLYLILINPENIKSIFGLYVLVLFIGAVQLFSISVLGVYLGKVFVELKGRPRFIIKKTLNFKK